MKIVFLDASTTGDVEEVSKIKELGEFVQYDITTAEELAGRISDADVIISNKVVIDRAAIDAAGNLKLICVAATGTNNIDLNYAAEKGIPVKNVKGYSTESVVQQTFTLMLGLLNKVRFYDEYVHSGAYSGSAIFTCLDKPFYEIAGKRLGIIGLGTIGRRVAAVAEAFGMKVCYYSTSGKNTDQPYERLELEPLLNSSDIVSIHAPLTVQTQNLIGEKQLEQMKPSAIIINTGRGGIIDEAALVDALNEGVIAGAALDVFSKEPLPAGSPVLKNLQDKGKLLLSPHIAWASAEARARLVEGIYMNIVEFIESGK